MINLPICKEIIYDSKFYLPLFKNEKLWVKLYDKQWFSILYYNYTLEYNNYNFNKNICSIDIGCKNFISLYGLNGLCYKIKSDYKNIDELLQNTEISYNLKDKIITDLINNLHNISAQFICNVYDIIYIGYVNNKGNINSKEMNTIEDNLLKILCHNKFLNVLKYFAKKYNKKLYIVDESFTSIQCGNCGECNKFKRIIDNDDSERRKYICQYCHNIFCRDLNAARNILIKNINKKN
jgi:transposase